MPSSQILLTSIPETLKSWPLCHQQPLEETFQHLFASPSTELHFSQIRLLLYVLEPGN